MTNIAGKYVAAKDVIQIERDGEGSSSTAPPQPSRRILSSPKASTSRPDTTVLALQAVEQETPVVPPVTPTWTAPPSVPSFFRPRTGDSRRPAVCCLCYATGHVAQDCHMLMDRQKELVCEAREAFLKATRTATGETDETSRYNRYYNKSIRVALVKAICEGILDSDEEGDSPVVLGKRADLDKEPPK